jgi:hypothetical protein
VETDWTRPGFAAGGGDAFVLFVVFGQLTQPFEVSTTRHRVTAVPDGIELRHLGPVEASAFFDPPLGALLLTNWEGPPAPSLVEGGCVLIRGAVLDPPDLRYLRNAVGLVTALMDGGGKAALNVQSLSLHTPMRWRSHIFDADLPYPRHHVTILHSDEEDALGPGRLWVHTRGMRLFGRPDISVRQVPPHRQQMADDLCNRFIEMLAFGHLIREGQAVRLAGAPEGLVCRHGGDLDDPDFNNVHVEIVWPADMGKA